MEGKLLVFALDDPGASLCHVARTSNWTDIGNDKGLTQHLVIGIDLGI